MEQFNERLLEIDYCSYSMRFKSNNWVGRIGGLNITKFIEPI